MDNRFPNLIHDATKEVSYVYEDKSFKELGFKAIQHETGYDPDEPGDDPKSKQGTHIYCIDEKNDPKEPLLTITKGGFDLGSTKYSNRNDMTKE